MAIYAILFLLAITSLSQAAPIARWAAAPPEVIGFWRMLGATAFILPFALRHGLRSFVQTNQRSSLLALASGLFFFLHLWAYVYAAQNGSIANCVIIFASNPIFTAAGAFVFLREKITIRQIVAFVFTGFGLLLLEHRRFRFGEGLSMADVCALMSAVFFSGYVLTGNASRRVTPNFVYSLLVYGAACVLFLAVGTLRQVNMTSWSPVTWIAIAVNVLVPTILGHTIYSYLLKHMNINLMSCGKLLEPLIASFSAWLFFNEILSIDSLLAFCFTAIGAVFLFWPTRTPEKVTSGVLPSKDPDDGVFFPDDQTNHGRERKDVNGSIDKPE